VTEGKIRVNVESIDRAVRNADTPPSHFMIVDHISHSMVMTDELPEMFDDDADEPTQEETAAAIADAALLEVEERDADDDTIVQAIDELREEAGLK